MTKKQLKSQASLEKLAMHQVALQSQTWAKLFNMTLITHLLQKIASCNSIRCMWVNTGTCTGILMMLLAPILVWNVAHSNLSDVQAEQQEREVQLLELTKKIRSMLQDRKGLEVRNKNLNQELAVQHSHMEELRAHKVEHDSESVCCLSAWTEWQRTPVYPDISSTYVSQSVHSFCCIVCKPWTSCLMAMAYCWPKLEVVNCTLGHRKSSSTFRRQHWCFWLAWWVRLVEGGSALRKRRSGL